MNKLRLGLSILTLVTVAAILAPIVCAHDPLTISLMDRLEAPSRAHWLGRDENGADVFAQLVYGARVSLIVAFSVVGVGLVIGVALGSWAGFRGGLVDLLVMRIVDVAHAFPNFLLALALVGMLGPSLSHLTLALTLTAWTSFARLVRAEVLHLKQREHVRAAEALGAGALRQVTFHVWPNLTGPLLAQTTFALAGTIIAESSLSFLGLGAGPSRPTWGALLSAGRRVLDEAPRLSLAPGLALVILVFALNLIGDGLQGRRGG